MIDPSRWIIEPLSPAHDRPAFSCGKEALDTYLQKQARQDVKRRISRVFVLIAPDKPDHILGYYTLSTLSLEPDHLPLEKARQLPRHPIPAALIGRLAVATQAQGIGVGGMLLTNAIRRIQAVSHEIAICALVVDAIDERAAGFYRQYGFTRLQTTSHRYYLPLKTL